MEQLETLVGLVDVLKRGLEVYPENFDIPKTKARIKELQGQIDRLTDSVNMCYNGNTNKH
jgi:hypothetical protein